jgi:predicted transcriptional regulator
MATLTLRVPPDLEAALEKQCAELGISKSDFARDALRRFLRVSEFRAIRSRMVAHAQSQGVHTDEDVFHLIGDE